jgi:hypothetical protein
MNRVRLLVLSMAFTFTFIAIGALAFGWAPPSVTDFILMTFIGAWSGDQCDAPPTPGISDQEAGARNG